MSARALGLLLWACCAGARAEPAPLADQELAAVRGADGVSFAVRLELNQPSADGTPRDSRLYFAHEVDGRTTYTVFKNVSGIVQMFGLSVSAKHDAGGQQYVAIGLPAMARFTNFGFESLSLQADPNATVTQSLGSVNLNGEMRMTGQLRLWSN